MTAFIRTGFFLFIFMSSLTVEAYEINAEFSAEAVQSMPDSAPVVANMFVSKKAVRTESTMNGNTMVEIVYPLENRRVLLNQAKKTYFEQKATDNLSAKKIKSKNSPCDFLVNTSCKKIGNEKINGREAVKWEMTSSLHGHDVKSLHWLDKNYHMPLREQFNDGTVSTMTLLGKETVNGRDAEKWEFHAIRPDGNSVKSMQWYDQKLKMVIREMLPGGYVRELRNINVAKQSKALFKIPGEYKKEEMQNMNAPGR